jgi:hypothetical protein
MSLHKRIEIEQDFFIRLKFIAKTSLALWIDDSCCSSGIQTIAYESYTYRIVQM